MLLGKSPLRISFVGGGTDLEEYHNRFDGYAISSTINLYTYVIAKLRKDAMFQGFSPDFASHITPRKYKKIQPVKGHEIVLAALREMNFTKGVDMFLCTDVEPNSGLGASSSIATNLVNVILELKKELWSKNKTALKSYKIGHDILKWGIGKQDEFASMYGGLNIFKFTKNKVTVQRININKSTKDELQKNSMLFHLGGRKHSSKVLNSQIEKINKSNPITLAALHKAKELTLEMRDALKANDLVQFSEIINKSWKEKKKYTEVISNKKIELVSKSAFSNGAIALKVTGAGGGGHMYLYAHPSNHIKIERALKKLDTTKVDFHFQNSGASVLDVKVL